MFAQAFHPAMRFAGPLRPQIGIRTVFNILGPLTNPAGATRQVIGVADRATAEKIAKALQLLGTDYALVVHGESGADEVDIQDHTLMYQVTPDILKRRRTRPADFGLPEGSRDHLVAESVEHSAQIIRTVFAGTGGEHNAPPSPERSRYNVVAINAAVALLAAGKAQSFNDAALNGQRQHRQRSGGGEVGCTRKSEQQPKLNFRHYRSPRPLPQRPPPLPSFPRRREPRTRGQMGAGHHRPSA